MDLLLRDERASGSVAQQAASAVAAINYQQQQQLGGLRGSHEGSRFVTQQPNRHLTKHESTESERSQGSENSGNLYRSTLQHPPSSSDSSRLANSGQLSRYGSSGGPGGVTPPPSGGSEISGQLYRNGGGAAAAGPPQPPPPFLAVTSIPEAMMMRGGGGGAGGAARRR